MRWPGKENIDLAPDTGGGFTLPEEGRYTVTLAGTTVRRSANGAWLKFAEKIDEGPHKGFEVEEEFWISDSGEKMGLTYAKLGNICEAAGWWPDLKADEKIEPEAFALLWPVGLRWSVDCQHEYQIKAWVNVNSYKDYTKTSPVETEECCFDKWLTVEKDAYDAWVREGGKTWTKLVPRRAFGIELQAVYAPAGEKKAEPVVEFVEDELPF